MSSNDLFSFLDEAPEETETNGGDNAMAIDTIPDESVIPRKRKVAVGTSEPRQNGGTSRHSPDSDPGPSIPKKPRTASPKPVVLDEVEIEAKREVAASAGLTGAVEEGSRLELKHQVHVLHTLTSMHFSYMVHNYRCDIKSLSHLVILIFLSPTMHLPRSQPVNISSLWILFNKCPCMLYNVTKAF